jgi:hypothetical protein
VLRLRPGPGDKERQPWTPLVGRERERVGRAAVRQETTFSQRVEESNDMYNARTNLALVSAYKMLYIHKMLHMFWVSNRDDVGSVDAVKRGEKQPTRTGQ